MDCVDYCGPLNLQNFFNDFCLTMTILWISMDVYVMFCLMYAWLMFQGFAHGNLAVERQVLKSFVFRVGIGVEFQNFKSRHSETSEKRLFSGTGIERIDSAYSAFRGSIGLDKDWYRNLGSGHDEAFDGPALLILGDNMPPEEVDAIIDSNALQLGNLVDAF